MYIKRKIEGTIFKYLEKPEIIAIVGPRQAGKTTLIQEVFSTVRDKAVFLTFEDREVLELFEKHTNDFITRYVKKYSYVFIDEFQHAKNGGKKLKFIYDTHHAKVILSGSSAIDLTVQAVKHLVGRILVFPLYPLQFSEIFAFQEPDWFEAYKEAIFSFKDKKIKQVSRPLFDVLQKRYHEYIRFGGYPRVVKTNDEEEKRDILRNIYNTYFLREVRDILGLVDDFQLSALLKALALQVGSLVELKELSNVSGLSYVTVKKYLNFLEKTYICGSVRPFFQNKRKEIVKNPKPYFFDTGLRNSVVNDFRKVHERPDGGVLLESALFVEFIKKQFLPHFWRTKQQEEVDFLIDAPDNNNLAFEVKMRFKNISSTFKNGKRLKQMHPMYELFYLYFLAPDESTQTEFPSLPLFLIS